MLFQINSMWQILGWVLVFAGLIITNSFSSINTILCSYSDWCKHRSIMGIKQPDL